MKKKEKAPKTMDELLVVEEMPAQAAPPVHTPVGFEKALSVPQQLRQQRQSRGITLGEVSENTKIGKKYLEALEEGNYEAMACEAYIQGFIRAYAKYLEMDEIRLIQEYKESRNLIHTKQEAMEGCEEHPGQNNQNIWMPVIIVLLLSGVAAAVFLLWPRKEAVIENAAVNKAAETIEPASPAAVEPPAAPATAQPMQLKVRARDKAWIMIMADGRQFPDTILQPGQEKSWEANDRFVLWTGNAGGIEVFFNNELQPALGKAGEVRKEVIFERKPPVLPQPAAPAAQ